MSRPQKPLPPLETLKAVFFYEPDLGYFCRRSFETRRRDRNKAAPGVHKHSSGYLTTWFEGKFYYVHRIAWALANDRLPTPTETIDHVNRDRRDNRAINLRLATRSQQRQNASMPRPANPHLPKGVHPNGKGYQVIVHHQGWGTFPTVDEAATHANMVRLNLFGEFACNDTKSNQQQLS
jgi:hypothetical protein